MSFGPVDAKIRGDLADRKMAMHQLKPEQIPTITATATTTTTSAGKAGGRNGVRATGRGVQGGIKKGYRKNDREIGLPHKTPQALGRASSSRY